MKYFLIAATLSMIVLYSCSSESSPAGVVVQNTQKKEQAYGKVNQILVIADSSVWRGAVGDTFFYYFGAPYILLPQPEPIFDVQHITPEKLAIQRMKKELRNLVILADLNDESSVVSRLIRQDIGPEKLAEIEKGKGYGVIVGQDKWAKGQQLFYVAGFGEQNLIDNIANNFPAIARKVNERDMETVRATVYQAGESLDLAAEIKAKFGLKLKLPADFKKARYLDSSNTLWLRRDDREIVANILITKVPYTDKSQLTKDGLKALRNKIGTIVSTQQQNTYMRINDVDLPLFVEKKTINNAYTIQAKGIWDIVNDFKGGPFITNLMLNKETNELVLVDAFIYAPREEKRDFMQEMELILSSAEF